MKRAKTVCSAAAIVLASCETLSRPDTPAPSSLDGSPPLLYSAAPSLEPSVGTATGVVSTNSTSTQYREVPRLTRPNVSGLAGGPSQPPLEGGRLSVTLPPQSVPEFINAVFGEILGTGYVLGPGVSEMGEIVSFRSANNIRRSDLYDAAANALRDYGVAIIYVDGEVRALKRDNLSQLAPRFIRSRARASVPSGMRPVVQFVDLYAMTASAMEDIVRSAIPSKDDLSIAVNKSSNSLTLTGLPGVVDQALRIINQMDELRFAGADVATLRVANWDVEALATTVEELLSIEGYSITTSSQNPRAIVMRPIPATQQLVIYATTQDMLDYVIGTVRRLDRDAQPQRGRTARVYQARHYEAGVLAEIISSIGQSDNDLTGETGARAPTPDRVAARRDDLAGAALGGIGDTAGGPVEAAFVTSGYVVDTQGNRIIFNATDSEYAQTVSLLRDLDTPASEVLIEVTIAEVTLTDDLSYGVEALISEIGSTGYSVGTLGNLGLAAGGLSGTFVTGGGDFRVDFGAGASNNQINVLSTPRIVTKSGGQANIQVGTDVPVITSQSAGLSQINGTTDLIQTVEYRKTGVLLNVAPLVLSDDRIDLEISQEVSSAEANPNQAISSPVISSRSITSALTLQDGQTAILGGLIENRYTRGHNGVPFLKDIPVLGGLFSTERLSSTNTILLVMITPYILDSRTDRSLVTNALAAEVNDAFDNQVDESVTLRPPTRPFRVQPRTAIGPE